MYNAATNVNDAQKAKRLSGHQYLDYLAKRPLIIFPPTLEFRENLHATGPRSLRDNL